MPAFKSFIFRKGNIFINMIVPDFDLLNKFNSVREPFFFGDGLALALKLDILPLRTNIPQNKQKAMFSLY